MDDSHVTLAAGCRSNRRAFVQTRAFADRHSERRLVGWRNERQISEAMSIVCTVYGLGIRASESIPGLRDLESISRMDVEVLLGLEPPWLDGALGAAQVWYSKPCQDEQGVPVLRVLAFARGAYFRLIYSDGTQFVVDRLGTQVWATWPGSSTLEDTATYLLGPVLGFVLRLRGVTCLHASAVAIGDRAIAILGPAGAGKSTTAAAFARAGRKVLTDDIMALDDRGDAFLVQPGYPRVRLWPASVNALYGGDDALPRLTPSWDKRYLDLFANGTRFQEESLPLAAIYLLGERCPAPALPFVELLSANESLMTLVANAYATEMSDKTMRAAEFRVLGRLLRHIPLRQVRPHADIASIQQLCDAIQADFESLNSSESLAISQGARTHGSAAAPQ